MRASLLHVVGAYFNHWRSPARAALARQWASDALDLGAEVTFVEHALGDGPYEFSPDEPAFKHVRLAQLRGDERYEVGLLKEALLNYGFSRLPETAKYVCWQDMDVRHVRADWAAETVEMLQHYFVGQTWTHSVDLDERGNVLRNEWGNDADRSFSAALAAGEVSDDSGSYLPPRALLDPKRKPDARSHSGYSWAIRRSALTGVGRLVDWDVIGSADYLMARCFGGCFTGKFDFAASPGYVRRWKEFARACDLSIRQSVGAVPGAILAGFHGAKTARQYMTRNAVLAESGFDPDRDLARDVHGLPMLIGDNRILRDGVRRYNILREGVR